MEKQALESVRRLRSRSRGKFFKDFRRICDKHGVNTAFVVGLFPNEPGSHPPEGVSKEEWDALPQKNVGMHDFDFINDPVIGLQLIDQVMMFLSARNNEASLLVHMDAEFKRKV